MSKITHSEVIERISKNGRKHGRAKLKGDIGQFKRGKLKLLYDWHPTKTGKIKARCELQNFCIYVCVILIVSYIALTAAAYHYFHDMPVCIVAGLLSILPLSILIYEIDNEDLFGTVIFNVFAFILVLMWAGLRHYA